MITIKDILNECECLQDDLLCFFDGMPEDVKNKMCDFVVVHFNNLKNKLPEN